MPLSLNEIRDRALAFSKEWNNERNEDAEAKSFWDSFFHVFGVTRRRIATFETRVRKANNRQGFIDLLWKGMLLIEHKSRGHDLDRAYEQAKDYFPGIKEHELPKYIIVCDFERLRIYDLDENTQREFKVTKLVDHIHLFDFLSGYKRHEFKEQDPVNIKAAELMGKLHDQLKAIGYDGHALELYLVRLLFCLFADDTGIFEKSIFEDYIELFTAEDGNDLAARVGQVFEILNTETPKRLKNIDGALAAFPYVNGKLFEEHLPTASFDRKMRGILLECCYLDWSLISPAIFGSLFQSVMDEKARRNLGAHYTSEKNIMKVIKPLFLDDLWDEFRKTDSRPQMQKFHTKLRSLLFSDPACGCGNFLIIAYRELRLLEIQVVTYLLKDKLERKQSITDIKIYFEVDVDQFYGIEYEEFPAQIAQVAMWLMDHQLNQLISATFGDYYVRIPLRKSATIVHGNALRTDWQSLITEEGRHYNYIFGNPPFIGSKLMSEKQREDLLNVFGEKNNVGVLDYVTAWYVKAAQILKNLNTKVAFVSTNSISQGEQVGILWNILFGRYEMKIDFAHQTFKWNNEARGIAAVYCIIIGFGHQNTNFSQKKLYQYENIKGDALEISVGNINPYLVEGKDLTIIKRHKSICLVPQMSFGNMPLDGGNLLLSDKEKTELIESEPKAEKFIKPLISAYEFLNGIPRWCLWLVDIEPSELKSMPNVLKRVENVRKFRLGSIAPSTQKFASTPYLFRDRQNPETYILIPSTTSENRLFIPIGFFKKNNIANNSTHIIPNGTCRIQAANATLCKFRNLAGEL
ncbi:MAG: class I SAM-dependent DNA methyltransferase [Taibaiella sp.]|nr:class I SAM-dependent DNA methyltransferase [Taibaiella sp.]